MPIPTFVPFIETAGRTVKATVYDERWRDETLLFFADGTYTRLECWAGRFRSKPSGDIGYLLSLLKDNPGTYRIEGELP
jgi:hypothetical protein